MGAFHERRALGAWMAERALGMWERAVASGCGLEPCRSVAGVRERLVEVKVRDELGVGLVEIGGLVEEEFALGQSARWGEGWRSVGKLEMEEDGLDGGGVSEESEDPHLAAAGGAQQGKHLVDPGEELSPPDAGRARRRKGRQRLCVGGRRGGQSADGGGVRAGLGHGPAG